MSSVRVIKLGGSLLLRRDLLDELRTFYESLQHDCPCQQTYLIVGGGQLIDAVRGWDAVHPSDPAEIHWQCVDLLRHTFQLVARAMLADPNWSATASFRLDFIDSPAEWSARSEQVVGQTPRLTLVNVPSFYHRGSRQVPLPESWETTTDAIAGYLAELSGAADCLLLKSCEVESQASIESWIQAGVIDPACRLFAAANFALRPICFTKQ